MKQRIWLLFLCFLSFFPLTADRIKVPPGDYVIQIPVGWSLFDKSDLSQLSFLSDDDSSVLQVSYFQGDRFQNTDEMYEQLISELDPQGDYSLFTYLNWNAWVGDLSFTLNQIDYRGWFILLDGQEWDYHLTLFCTTDDYEINFPWMISALDGFAPGKTSLRSPGVISAMMYFGEEEYLQNQIQLDDEILDYRYNRALIDESQDYIEREAKILYEYRVNEPLFHMAWERYYNLIYKDNYSSLIPVFRVLTPLYHNLGRDVFIDTILQWIQGFEYSSSGTFSDLLSPLTAAIENRGDCDSLALLYLMILEHHGIDGVFIVSEEYSHAMAAVESDREGASFEFEGKRYVVAELTDQVALGQIASSMADLSKWQIIKFPGKWDSNQYSY